jgi:DNA polymerase III subunit beta
LLIDRVELQWLLKTLGKVVNRKSSIPILSGILIRYDGKNLIVDATNLAQHISIGQANFGEDSINVAVNYQQLSDLVTNMPASGSTIELIESSKKLIVRFPDGSSTGTITCDEKWEDFPLIAKTYSQVMGISVGDILSGLKFVTPAAGSMDSSLATYPGVNIKLANSIITFSTTNGYRMAYWKIDSIPDRTLDVTIPLEAVSLLTQSLEGYHIDDLLEINTGPNGTVFVINETYISTANLEVNFPDLSRATTLSSSDSFTMDSAALRSALKYISTVARHSNQAVEFNFDNGRLNLHSDAGFSDASTSIAVIGNGTYACKLHASMLLDELSAMEGSIDFSDMNSRNIVIRPTVNKDCAYIQGRMVVQ